MSSPIRKQRPEARVEEKRPFAPSPPPRTERPSATTFPPTLPKPVEPRPLVYEFTPKTCPDAIFHHAGKVCPKCGATEA